MEPVLFYEGEWYMFSNFSAFAIYWQGEDWMTSEHAYQAAKFESAAIQSLIIWARSPLHAKSIARTHRDSMRPDWTDSVKLDVMESILRAKLDQYLYIQQKLLATGDRIIIEDSPTDGFWGRGPDGKGENHLGRIWMKLRTELQSRNISINIF